MNQLADKNFIRPDVLIIQVFSSFLKIVDPFVNIGFISIILVQIVVVFIYNANFHLSNAQEEKNHVFNKGFYFTTSVFAQIWAYFSKKVITFFFNKETFFYLYLYTCLVFSHLWQIPNLSFTLGFRCLSHRSPTNFFCFLFLFSFDLHYGHSPLPLFLTGFPCFPCFP